jgi:peptide/nickel transport system substrate-binding protein
MVMSVLLAIGLTSCTSGYRVAEGTSVTVALDAPFTSYNANTGHGSANDTNASIVAATNSAFASWDASGELVFDESFGSVEKVSDDPLRVNYSIADGVQWSDGVDVDAADLLLAWVANSRAMNDDVDAEGFIDQETGLFTEEFPDDAVYFDGFTANGLDQAGRLPEVTGGGRGITLTFDEHVADWAAIFTVGLPAHVVGQHAFDRADDVSPEEAKSAVITAIQEEDGEALAAISKAWNSEFTVEGGSGEATELVGTGPYSVAEIADEGVTLSANRNYRGEHRPRYETIVVRYIADPLEAVAALERGEVDVISPQPSADVMAALRGFEGDLEGEPRATSAGVWELLQVRFDESANGAIEDERVRDALLRSVPRATLVDEAGAPGARATLRDSFTMMPGTGGYEESITASANARFEHDPAAAAELIDEAAADDPALAAPTVCILFDPANPRRVAQFSEIRDAAASVGITVTDCSSPDWRNLLGTPGAWDAALYGLRERNLSVQAATAMFHSGSSLNHGRFASDEVDELVERLEWEESPGERAALRAELDALLWEKGWGLPLLQLPSVTAVARGVEGVSPSPYAPTVLHDAWRWHPTEAAG